ncbi:hypothetical protein [Cognatishimia sp.]|uniref:hypothetical protein n=1 Tax=Cognatishimia sp. TaxID=2211648 RepID=UPI003518ECE7
MHHRRVIAAICVLCSLPMPAQAQSTAPCGERDQVITRLAEKFGEQVQAQGLDNNNGMVEVFANTDSGSWTITITSATGLTCLMASGNSFVDSSVARLAPKDDA